MNKKDNIIEDFDVEEMLEEIKSMVGPRLNAACEMITRGRSTNMCTYSTTKSSQINFDDILQAIRQLDFERKRFIN